ncbi:MAG: dihydrolipoyl dehydrogenase [Omnitrophica WOR_2 bacterium RBG_13_41_10]|nr:MAG: dihydrolipoyl dehydrogenase [Omnitrophica WOR_2 bacterium RBG_13_41_10]
MDYDLVVIGAGWAGFNAAIKAKGLGLKVALIDKAELGGTCLNKGCIPTKSLIQSAKIYSLCKKAGTFGVETLNPQVNFLKIQERKDKIVQQLKDSMQFMLGGIDFINAEGQIISHQEVRAADKTLKTKFILIATGSRPQELKSIPFDAKKIISSDDALGLKEIPKKLLIIGGGVIGCEFASLFSSLGSEVTIVEMMPQLLPGIDKEVAKKIETIFKKRMIKVNTNTDAKTFNLQDYDTVLVCVGRSACTSAIGLEKIGVNLGRGKIIVDKYLKTNIPNIFAAGDSTGQIMLAHFASYQGEIAAGNIAHPENMQEAKNTNVPNCIFTEPQIATVGLKEEELNPEEINVYKFDFLGLGMGRILEESEGFIKVISDKKSDEILGAAIIGPGATELIAILTVAISNQLKAWQIRNTIFAHPTLSESIHQALKKEDGI